MDVENLCLRAVSQQPIAHGVHQMGLAQTDATVNKQGVVHLAGCACHMHGGGSRHPVGLAFDQCVKGQSRVQPVLQQPAGNVALRLYRRGRQSRCLSSYRGRLQAVRQGIFPFLALTYAPINDQGPTVDPIHYSPDSCSILGPYPIQLEAVGHVNQQAHTVGTGFGAQRSDPGAELLLG